MNGTLGEKNLERVKGANLVIPRNCFGDSMGHKNLLYCFWKEGKSGGEFDDHAAGCNICVGQAMLAFLWKDLGASDQEILKGMEIKFERLEKERQKKGISTEGATGDQGGDKDAAPFFMRPGTVCQPCFP